MGVAMNDRMSALQAIASGIDTAVLAQPAALQTLLEQYLVHADNCANNAEWQGVGLHAAISF